MGPLEKQSETAKEYLKKKEELKTYDINMFLLEEERIRDCLKETQKKLEIASLELEESNISYDKMNMYIKIEIKKDKFSSKGGNFYGKL